MNIRLLSVICVLIVCLTNCSIIEIGESVNIRFKNTTAQTLDDFTANNKTIGQLNNDEISDYFHFDLKDNSTMDLSAFIENTNYNNELSVMYIEHDMGFCGVGLEQMLMLEKGQNYTMELSLNKDYPNQLMFALIMD